MSDLKCSYCGHTAGCYCSCPTDKPPHAKHLIFQSLDNAIANGYELQDWKNEEITQDLHEYDSQFDNVDHKLLLPFVKEWHDKKFRGAEMTEDILYISCDRCGAKTSQDEIYLDNHENTICINCHNYRVWKKGWWDGFTMAAVIWIVLSMIAIMLMKIF